MSSSRVIGRIVTLGQEAAEAPAHELEAATKYALTALADAIGAMNAYWVGAVREDEVAPGDPMLGWRARDIFFAHDHEQMMRATSGLIARIERGEIDIATTANVRQAGKTRCFLRNELVPDPIWLKSWVLNEYHRPRGVEDQLVATHALAARHESYIGLMRGRRDPDFTTRSRDLLLLFVQSSRTLHRRLMFVRGLTASPLLTRRERDVMRALMSDASEKEIAKQLGMSERTVHQHARAIYAKHHVRGRLGIMAAGLAARDIDARSKR